jgi:mannose/cellobiose epimerase-like protein (N-acyl-D-glucosamine 2-epimerase family)
MSQASTRGPGTRKEDWIAHQLRRVYDNALQDAVPPEMMKMLNALDGEDEPEAEIASEPGEDQDA